MKVLITGASSGIGLETARVFARNKWDLVLVARREKLLYDIKNNIEKEYGVKVEVEVLDLSNLDTLNLLWEKYLQCDVVINNAGFGRFDILTDYDKEIDIEMIKLNTVVPTLLTKEFIKVLKKGSKIINVASTAGYQPVPYMATYSATKSYLIDFTLATAQESKDIDVVLYCPGETKTEFQSRAKRPKSSPLRGPIPSADKVAEDIYETCIKNKSYRIYGIYNRILIFLSSFLSKERIAKGIYKTNGRLG